MAANWAGVISNNPTFQYLDLSTVKMSPRAAEKLLIGLNKSSAVKLNLDCDTLPTQSLGQTLTQLKTLQQIKIDCFEYTKEAADYLVQQMATLPNLVNVTIKRPPSLEAVLGFIQQSKSVQMIRFYCCDYTEPELNQLLDLVEFIDRKVRLEITASLGVPCASDIFRERIEQVNA
jgi:hypothetical protein